MRPPRDPREIQDDAHLVTEVVAELGSTLLDADGRDVDALDGRLIGISSAELQAVPQRVAIGGGAGKYDAVLAVLRSGLADVVITDVASARYALERDGVEG